MRRQERQAERQPGERLPPEMKADIDRLVEDGKTAGEIETDLGKKWDDLPDRRTIQRYIKAYRERIGAEGEAWDWSEAEEEEAALVQEALAAAVAATEGRVISFSKSQAEWIAKIRLRFPRWPPYVAWKFGTAYASTTDRAPLDLSLTVAAGLTGVIATDRPLIVSHVDTHVQRWGVRRILIVWAKYREASDAYISAIGEKHGSLVTRETPQPVDDPYHAEGGRMLPAARRGEEVSAGQAGVQEPPYSYFDPEHFFGRLIIMVS